MASGFAKGLNPQLIKDGTSGTYKLKEATDNQVIGIFKPFDEEPFAPNNQKGYVGNFGSQSFRRGIYSGEATIREVAAYVLDRKNIFGIPPTTFIELSHISFNKNNFELFAVDEKARTEMWEMVQRFLRENTPNNFKEKSNNNNKKDKSFLTTAQYNFIPKKYGSLQKYIDYDGIAADFSNTLFSVEEAHKIMILDIRIVNCDRNDENILLIKEKIKNKNNAAHKEKKEKYYWKLIPIDHALSFPDKLEILDSELCWTSWEQAEEPFTKEEKKFINNIRILRDMKKLNKIVRLRENCWKLFRASNILLKIGAIFDLTPLEISRLLYRDDCDSPEEPSKIELIIEKTDRLCSSIKVDKRLRLFSCNYQEKNENLHINNDIENKTNNNCIVEKRESKFMRKAKKISSLLERTTSEPKIRENNSEEKDNNNSKGKKEGDDEYENIRPKKNDNESINNNEKINIKVKNNSSKEKKKKNMRKSRNNSISDEIIFDSPFNQMYFRNFGVFLEEIIKKDFPERYEKYKTSFDIDDIIHDPYQNDNETNVNKND